jgi:hypothetical protein
MRQDSHQWSSLTPLQVGQYAEYLVKMAFTLFGFDVRRLDVIRYHY